MRADIDGVAAVSDETRCAQRKQRRALHVRRIEQRKNCCGTICRFGSLVNSREANTRTRARKQQSGEQLTRSKDGACAASSTALAELKNPNLGKRDMGNSVEKESSSLTRLRPKNRQPGTERTREIRMAKVARGSGRWTARSMQ